jgi:hypothetical protein
VSSIGWAEFEWADSAEALTVALAKGISEQTMRTALVLDPKSAFEANFSEALDRQDHRGEGYIVQIDEVGGWLAVIEPNGFLLSLPEIIVPMSRHGHVISAFWNVNSAMEFILAVGGRVRRRFDPLLYTADEDALPEESGLPFGHPGHPRAAALTLIARLTGATLTADWVLKKRRATLVSRYEIGPSLC